MKPSDSHLTGKDSQSHPLSRGLILLMSVACGMIVANLYYNQPLLADIGRSFDADAEEMGLTSMLIQIGYAAGIFLFVPLGDIRVKRKLITGLQIGVTLALIAAAAAQSLTWMYVASFAVGFTAIATQLLIPFAAELASPDERGKVVGTLLSGLLVGIVLSRILAGYIGEQFGWRAVYWLAALLMFGLGCLLQWRLPRKLPELQLAYPTLLRSMGTLFVEQRTLRESALVGACMFGALSVFWTALPYFLEGPHYHMGSSATGLFSLVGLVGAAAAPWIGRLADRINARLMAGFIIAIGLLAQITLLSAGYGLTGLIVGAILLDFGIQGTQVTNQSRVYGMLPEARSRLNTVLMVCTFVGGSLGASIGGYAWSWWGWQGTCLVGGAMVLTAIVLWASHRERNGSRAA